MLPERRSICVHLILYGVSCVNQKKAPTFEMTLKYTKCKNNKVKSNPSKCNIQGFIDFGRVLRGCVDRFCMLPKCVIICVHLIWHGVSCVNQTPWPQHLR